MMMKQRAAKRPAEERKRMILESAQAVFARSSYADASTEEVARGAGVATSAIYRYFPSKRELYLAALRDSGTRLLSMWRESASALEDPLQTLFEIGMNYYDHVQTRSSYARFWFRALADASDSEVRDAIAANHLAMVDLLASQLAAAQANGLVRRDVAPRIAAWHFLSIGLTFDLLSHLGLDDELDRDKVEHWGRFYIESIREGAHGTSQNAELEPGGTLPVRQPRGASHAARGGDSLPEMSADPPHSLGAGGHGGRSP